MLQWMGGSRRKVTTSRKSTQKRQKQYFEQRKRQQQQQQQSSNGPEIYSERKAPCTQCHENNRSLDILGLLNLSKNGQDSNSRFSEVNAQGRGSQNGQRTTPKSQRRHYPTTVQMENEKLCSSEDVEIRETRTASKHVEETGRPQDSLPDASKGNNEKDPMKMTTDHKLSVVDILSDDGQNSSSRGNLVHENHVSFSIEGLGKVGMETPVHSPQHPTRKFSYGCPAPSKIFKASHSSKNLNRRLGDQFPELDDMAAGGDIPTDPFFLKLPHSRELFRNSKQKIVVDKECLETPVHSPQHPTRKFSHGCPAPSKFFKGSHSHSSKNLNRRLGDQFPELDDMAVGGDMPTDPFFLKLPHSGELFRNSEQKIVVDKERFVHDAEDFLSNDEFSESRVEHDRFTWHEKPSFLDDNFLDDNCDVCWKNWLCDSDYMRSRKCDESDFSFEGGHMQKRRARVDAASCFNVSGLSSPYKHQINHRYDFMTSDMTRCNPEFGEMAHSPDWPCFAKEDARDRLHLSSEDTFLSCPVWHERTKNPSYNSTERQRSGQHAADSRSPFSMKNNTFSHGFGMKSPNIWQHESMIGSGTHNTMSDFSTRGDDWFSEERCNTETYAYMKASETPEAPHFDCKSWTKNQFDSDFDPKFHVNEKPSSSRSKHGAFSDSFFSEKVAFCQQISPGQSSPVLPHIKEEFGHQEPHDDSFNEEKDDSDVQLQKSVSTRESESVTLPAITSTFHQHKENSNESNYSSSKSGTPVNVLHSEESQVKTPEMTPAPNAVLSPGCSEGGSSSVEMPSKLEDCDGLKECPDGTQTSLLSQYEHKETEDSGQNSCKVMVLGRFVL